jgi:hypothetical protein
VLSTAGLLAVVYGLIEAPSRGWADPLVLATLVGGAVVLAGFCWWVPRAHPGVDDAEVEPGQRVVRTGADRAAQSEEGLVVSAEVG